MGFGANGFLFNEITHLCKFNTGKPLCVGALNRNPLAPKPTSYYSVSLQAVIKNTSHLKEYKPISLVLQPKLKGGVSASISFLRKKHQFQCRLST